jgi:hypothetical protein
MPGILRLMALAMVAALGAWFWHHVWRAIRTGTANLHNDLVRRRDRPVRYWVAVAVQATFAAACTVGVARGLVRWLSA